MRSVSFAIVTIVVASLLALCVATSTQDAGILSEEALFSMRRNNAQGHRQLLFNTEMPGAITMVQATLNGAATG